MHPTLTTSFVALVASSCVAAALQTEHQPHRIPLKSRHVGQRTPFRKRAVDAIGVPLSDFFLGTDLQWFGNISGLCSSHT